jgi:ABC-type Fe3+ transport system permease subunit
VTAADVVLAFAGALIACWLSLFVAALVWLCRRVARRARRELNVIARAAHLRTRRAIVDGVDAVAVLCWLLVAVLGVAPFALTVGPLVLAVAGLDLTFHLVKVGH